MISIQTLQKYQAEFDAALDAVRIARPGAPRRAAEERFAAVDAQRPALTQALLRMLIEEDADPEYVEARLLFEAAANRCRMLRSALAAWGPADALPRPLSRTKLLTNNLNDARFREYRSLEKQGIRLPLLPHDVVMPPSCSITRDCKPCGRKE